MKDNTAISVKGVKKNFLLPHEKTSSIKSGVVNVFRKKNRTISTQKALRGVSFDIKKGEFFGILGKNGSGKSTLLKILAEIYQPTEGSVDISGKLVPFIELGVGFNPELTGRENVYLNGALLGFSRKEIDARYDDIVKFAELEEFMDQKLKNYSSGMQVRLAFSVATRAEADILLVDEVLAVGDADFQRKCYDFFKSLKASGKTVIFVTHDMGAVRDYCDRAVIIKNGKVSFEGDADKAALEYLDLFNKEQEEVVEENEDKPKRRPGNGMARFDLITATVKKDVVIIKSRIKNKKRENTYIVGLRIYDGERRLLAGGNTRMYLGGASNKAMTFAANEVKTITYKIDKTLFGSGTYWIGSSIKLDDRVTQCDDVMDAAKFSITSDQSYFQVVIPADVEVKSEAKR